MNAVDYLVGIGAVILAVAISLLLFEAEARRVSRESDEMRRHINREEDAQ